MKLFVYSMREYDELAFFEKFCGESAVFHQERLGMTI